MTASARLFAMLAARDAQTLQRCVQDFRADDWQRVAAESVFHEVETVLHHRLGWLDDTSSVPDDVLAMLHERYAIHALRNRRIFHELAIIVDALHAASVPTIALKGAYLAWCIHPDPALRSMGDLDLMVRSADLSRAETVLHQLGYQSSQVRVGHHLPALKKTGATTVEIHWTIEDPKSPFAIDVDGLWQRAIPVRIADREMLALAPADLLLHLCIHIGYHHRFGLRSHEGLAIKHLYDLVVLAGHRDVALDWDVAGRVAAEWGADRYVYTTIGVINRLFDSPVDAPAACFRRDSADDSMIQLIADSFLTRPSIDADGYRRWVSPRGFTDHIRFASRRLFPGTARIAEIYQLTPGSPRVWVSAVLRPFHLLGRYLWTRLHLGLNTRAGRALAAREAVRRELEQWTQSQQGMRTK